MDKMREENIDFSDRFDVTHKAFELINQAIPWKSNLIPFFLGIYSFVGIEKWIRFCSNKNQNQS
jgi:hypothetical protein